jgi:hypothetical protein
VNEEIKDLDQWLRKKLDSFLILELETWHSNKKEWPQKRNYKMFKEWFPTDISTFVYVIEKKPISKAP